MALRTIRELGDPVLEKKAKAVKEMTPKIRQLIEDMKETMYDADGVGLAAPQIGMLKRIVVIDISAEQDQPIVLINPEIVEKDGEQTGWEGCLSVPPYQGIVSRYPSVQISYLQPDGTFISERVEGYSAIIFQHECDHLDGILYTDKADSVYVNEAWAAERKDFKYTRPAWWK